MKKPEPPENVMVRTSSFKQRKPLLERKGKDDLSREPYWQGYGAFRDGLNVHEDNPYKDKSASREFQAWFIGWVDARIESKARRSAGEWWASQGLWYGVLMVVIGIVAALQQQLITDYPQIASGLFAACGALMIALKVLGGTTRRQTHPIVPLARGKIPYVPPPKHRPPYGLCLPAELEKVTDGDTVNLSSGQLYWPIRLINCWCHEDDTRKGKAATKHAKKILREAKYLSVWIPVRGGLRNLLRLLTLNRVPAHVFLGDTKTFSEEMVKAGHAAYTKEGQEKL